VVLLAASVYLVKQDVVRASRDAVGRGERRLVTQVSVPAAEPAAAMVDMTR
jgi:hypothetical protein